MIFRGVRFVANCKVPLDSLIASAVWETALASLFDCVPGRLLWTPITESNSSSGANSSFLSPSAFFSLLYFLLHFLHAVFFWIEVYCFIVECTELVSVHEPRSQLPHSSHWSFLEAMYLIICFLVRFLWLVFTSSKYINSSLYLPTLKPQILFLAHLCGRCTNPAKDDSLLRASANWTSSEPLTALVSLVYCESGNYFGLRRVVAVQGSLGGLECFWWEDCNHAGCEYKFYWNLNSELLCL